MSKIEPSDASVLLAEATGLLPKSEEAVQRLCLVGLGGEGVDALTRLLREWPQGSDVPPLVIVHRLTPQTPPTWWDTAVRHSGMPVIAPREAMRLEEGQIYWVPDEGRWGVVDGCLTRRPLDKTRADAAAQANPPETTKSDANGPSPETNTWVASATREPSQVVLGESGWATDHTWINLAHEWVQDTVLMCLPGLGEAGRAAGAWFKNNGATVVVCQDGKSDWHPLVTDRLADWMVPSHQAAWTLQALATATHDIPVHTKRPVHKQDATRSKSAAERRSDSAAARAASGEVDGQADHAAVAPFGSLPHLLHDLDLINTLWSAVMVTDKDLHVQGMGPLAPSPNGESNPVDSVFASLQAVGQPVGPLLADVLGETTATELVGLAKQTMVDGCRQQAVVQSKDARLKAPCVQVAPLHDAQGQCAGTVWVFMDLDVFRQVQKDFERQHTVFEQILEGTLAGYWDWNIPAGTEYLSPSFKQMFGYADHELENTPEAWQQILHPDDLPTVLENFEAHVKSHGAVPYDNVVRYFHKDGHVVWVSCRGKVIEWDGQGHPLRMIGSHVDITPIKLQGDLKKQNEELMQFAYIASHDLQAPLNTIVGFAELLKSDCYDALGEQGQQYLQFINDSSARMRELVSALLRYSRIGRQGQLQKVDCNQLIRNVQDDLKSQIQEADAKIVVGDLPIVRGYGPDLRLLFQNLLHNAVKFRKKDEAPIITVTAETTDSHWAFAMQDNGIGIDPKHKERVFQIFQRLHGRRDYDGTGIGLANCKKVVEMHAGTIELESALGEGCTFRWTLSRRLSETH